jgi:DNA modification methylase
MRTARILVGDVRDRLQSLQAQSVQCCVTSPPYWGLRDYGTSGQLGLESTPDLYVQAMVEVFREVKRVLRDDGTCWVNLGDSYAGSWGNQGRKEERGTQRPINGEMLTPVLDGRFPSKGSNTGKIPDGSGLKPKDLVGIPWRVAFALQADGWYLRSDIIWSKPNPMPESVTDRPTKAHEYLFLLTKRASYYYDNEAIREDGKDWSNHKPGVGIKETQHYGAGNGGNAGLKGIAARYRGEDPPTTRNKRSVWHIATQPYSGAHFATFPEALIEPCILAGSRVGDTVIDPFCGSGTTGVVSCRHNRHFIGVELNPAYAQLAEQRILGDAALLNKVEVA